VDAGRLGDERHPQLRSRKEPNGPERIADEAKPNGVGLDQSELGERARGVWSADSCAVELSEISIEKHDRQLIFEGHVVRREQHAERAPLDSALEDCACHELAGRNAIDENLAPGRLVLVGLLQPLNRDAIVEAHTAVQKRRSTPKAASAPPTKAPMVTQTGAPGPHARPARAPPATPPAMPAPVTETSRMATRDLSSAVAME